MPPSPALPGARFKILDIGQLNPLKNLPFLLQGFCQLVTTGGVDVYW